MKYIILDKEKGENIEDLTELALRIVKDKMNSRLVYCDIEGITNINGQWYILDECGTWEYIPPRFEIKRIVLKLGGC